MIIHRDNTHPPTSPGESCDLVTCHMSCGWEWLDLVKGQCRGSLGLLGIVIGRGGTTGVKNVVLIKLQVG